MDVKSLLQRLSRVLFILVSPVSLIAYLCGFRLLKVSHIEAIGHFAIEPNLFLMNQSINGKRVSNRRIILLAPQKKYFFSLPHKVCCNVALAKLWKKYFTVVLNPILTTLLYFIFLPKFLQIDCGQFCKDVHNFGKSFKMVEGYTGPPFVKLSKEQIRTGFFKLAKEGVNISSSGFITFFARDSNYRNCHEFYTSRNYDINNYELGLKVFIDAGYTCIRLGSRNSLPLNQNFLRHNKSKVFEYSRSDIVSDEMDLFLISQSNCFITGSSGLTDVANIFQTPILQVAHFPAQHLPLQKRAIVVPKLYKDSQQDLIPFCKLYRDKLGGYIHDSDLKNKSVSVVDPTPQDIRAGCLEMLDFLRRGHFEVSTLQHTFNQLVASNSDQVRSFGKVSQAFLIKHINLMQES